MGEGAIRFAFRFRRRRIISLNESFRPEAWQTSWTGSSFLLATRPGQDPQDGKTASLFYRLYHKGGKHPSPYGSMVAASTEGSKLKTHMPCISTCT